jgi:hypothetical protein
MHKLNDSVYGRTVLRHDGKLVNEKLCKAGGITHTYSERLNLILIPS